MITFYSYKGGTGRSMALANTACLLAMAKPQPKVLVIDWDLEAPGLHRYFATKSEDFEESGNAGLIDYFWSLRKKLEADPTLSKRMEDHDAWDVMDEALPIDRFIVHNVFPGIDLITAGKLDAAYSKQVNSFNWVSFYEQYGSAITAIRNLISRRYDYCLVDSRTGVTDTSGICTVLLPEKLVAVFTPNKQSLYGLLELLEQAIEYRRASNDFRPLSVFPLPSRIDIAEKNLRQTWRREYQAQFERLFKRSYGLEKCDLDAYFDEIQLPYMSYYSYGENLAVLEERSDSLSLSRAYEAFYTQLSQKDFAWISKSTATDRPLRVFIAHSTGDKPVVRELYRRLKSDGFTPWLDEQELLPGQDWQQAIPAAVRAADVVLIPISKASATKEGYVQSEIRYALEIAEEKPPGSSFIIPVRLDPVELPERLRRWQWANLFEEDGYERLATALRIRAKEIGIAVIPT